jgi:hypothetical protein
MSQASEDAAPPASALGAADEALRAADDGGVLTYPGRSLVLVIGLPGAGKTTLLQRVYPGARDPETIRARYRRHLGRLPYRIWRPLVYVEHYLKLFAAFWSRKELVVHEPGTRRWLRLLLTAAARHTGRSAHAILLDVDPGTARAAQHQRGRVLSTRSQRAHVRRWARLRPGEDFLAEGYRSLTVLSRPAAAGVTALRFAPGG